MTTIADLEPLPGTPHALRFASYMPSSDAPPSLTDIADYARRIEQAGFTALFLDEPARPGSFEPLTLASALATVTDRLGLVTTVGTSFNEPFHVARRLASIDHISLGRAGWLVDTRDAQQEVGGFFTRGNDGRDADEFLRILRGLWDSYADDAIVVDKQSGIYFRPEGRRPLNHAGTHFRVAGPLNLARSPQAHPVIFHDATSQDDLPSAAMHADIVLVSARSIEEVRTWRARLDEALAAAGRNARSVHIWPIIAPVVTQADERTEGASMSGTPEQLADHIAQWSAAGAAQGFVLRFPMGMASAHAFVDAVLPILFQRGLLALPDGMTLREVLGLSRPERSAA